MKRLATLCVFLVACSLALPGYPVYFKEQFYRLYHIHYIQYPDDTIENIYFLEQAQKADFCNPLYALAKIEDKRHWERYRYLFNMHIELKMIEQHLYLGAKFDKQVAYFYNAPWKRENLESLEIAETAYRAALAYWPGAQEWARKAEGMRFIFLPDVQAWEDESFRIVDGQLDYGRIIERELKRLAKVRADFEAMDEAVY
ncbi:MAG: hypothetical protein RBT62_03425 [Spirochaetia bacterium]|jgi:hypothetical protein|nr:hypothetical protein [Spirochaetia bacterium]